MIRKTVLGIAATVATFVIHAAWYDSPSILKLVPLATSSSATEDPHFMNKSADDATLLVNMQASNDNDGPVLLDMEELATFGKTPTIRKVFAKPSAVGGSNYKGGAISSDLDLAILGNGSGTDACSFKTDATSWTKGANLWLSTFPNKMDGLDFGTGSKYLYANLYPNGGIARFKVSENYGLVNQVTKETASTRVRNVSVYNVGGKELVYYGNGEDNTTDGKVYVMDATDADVANWTETELKLGDDAIVVPGVITNVKLSNEDSDAPIMYALTDNGYLGIYKLAADGKSVVETIKTIAPEALKVLAGGTKDSTAKFRNFEVTKDGETAFLINRKDEHNVSLAVLQTLPAAYIESDGTSYIDTGYTPTPDTAVYVDFEYRDVTSQQFIFESGDSVSATNSNKKAYFRQYISGSGLYAWALHQNLWQNFNTKATIGERCQALYDGQNLKVTFRRPAETKTATYGNWSRAKQASAYTFKLFSSSWGTGNKAKARIYRFKIYEAGELVRDFTPAKRDGFVGFRDSVTGDFIYGGESGFTAGGVDALPEINDPYIESNGSAGINTGVQAQPGLKIEVDYQISVPFEQMVAQWRIVSTDAGSTSLPRVSAYVNGNKYIALTSGDSWASATSTDIKPDTLRHKVILGDTGNKCHYTIGNNILKTISGNAITKRSTVQIALLATPNKEYGATFGNTAKAKLYGAKFWVNGKLIRDFRPRTLNGVAGLEDVAQGGFYTASGYTASAGVTEGLTATPAYIQNDGSFFSYVNTHYYVNPKTKVELDYQLVKLETSRVIFGSYGASVGTTALMWHDSSGFACPQAKDGNYSSPTMSPKVYMDSGRHTALLDIPAGRLAVMDVNGVVETEGTCSGITKTAAWPSLLFSASKDKYGHSYHADNRTSTCRIYGVRIWEKEGDEYVLKHNFTPVKMTGIPGFKDTVTGKFFSGDKLTAGGTSVPTMDDCDPYLDSPDGGRYFDTGYKVTKNTSVWVDYMPLLQQNNQQFPYEAGTSASDGKMYIRTYGNGSTGQGDYSHAFGTDTFKPSYVPYQPNVRVQIFNDTVNKRFKVLRDGVELGGTNYASWATSSITANSSTTLKIFCDYEMKGSSCRGRLYGFKIYESGVLVRDYVPVDQAGAGALFDKVQGKVLKKASSNDFVMSDDLTANDAWLMADQRAGDAYITSDGSQAIDTGYIPKPNSRFEIDYQFTSFDGQNRIFGETSDKNVGLSAEMYIQGTTSGSGNVAYGVGDEWKGQYTEKGGDKNRNRGFLDVAAHAFGYSGNSFGMKAETTAYTATLNGSYATVIFGRNAYGTMTDFSKMKLYAFRIYESGALVHQYLPYKNGNVVGVYDTVTDKVLTDCRNGNAFTYGGEGYGQYRGDPCDLVVKPENTSVGNIAGSKKLTAYAPGAVRYEWTMNGEVLDETSGSLTVYWRRHTRGPDNTDTYTATPIFSVEGEEVRGKSEEALVTSKRPGLSIFVR